MSASTAGRSRSRRIASTAGLVLGLAALVVVFPSGHAAFTGVADTSANNPTYAAGSTATPTGAACRWINTTNIQFDWANAAGVQNNTEVQRSVASGGPFATVATVAIPGTSASVNHTTGTNSATVTTTRYYALRSILSPTSWVSGLTAELASNTCRMTVLPFAGNGTAGFAGDGGAATAARLNAPAGLAFDAGGNLYIADRTNCRVRMVTPGGTISTVAGNGTCGFAGDGGAATAAQLNLPQGVSVNAGTGDIYIADTSNCRIRMVSGGTITTVAGSGTCGYLGDGGAATAARLNLPIGVFYDAAGANLYIADTTNCRVRRVNAGTITTFAGNGTCGFLGDGGAATAARLSAPRAVAADATGANVYIADYSNARVRRVNAGTISTFAGGGASTACTYSGAPTGVSMSGPWGLAVDAGGRVFVVDSARRCVRVVNGGTMSQVGFTGTNSSTGNNGTVYAATISTPAGLALDATGNVLVSDFAVTAGSSVVRRILGPVP